MADEGTKPPSPPAPDPAYAVPPPAAESAAPAKPELRPDDRDAALERERWLREQIDKERMLLLLFGRHVVRALEHEAPILRLWRWLIDDLRSERREEAEQVSGVREHGGLTRLAVRLQRSWRSLRWRRVVNG
jgi:hypothetical protein